MALDLVVTAGTIRGHEAEGPLDMGVQGGRIVAISPHLDPALAHTTVDATGKLVAPSFVDPHVHLDKALITESVRDNVSGTLTEAIEIIWERKRHYEEEEILGRARRVIELAVSHGTTALRTHVDVDTIGGLVPVRALLRLKAEVADMVDLQLVAFPQEGVWRDPGTDKLMEQAMELGCDAVGGMPYNERTPADSQRHVDFCLELARRYDADVDMHIDETDDPGARTLAMLADATIRQGWQGRVTAGHTCALAAYPDPYAAKVIGLVKEAGIHVITNPATNLMLQGRLDHQPVRRGITRVKELLAAGVNLSFGQDCLKDTFYPTFGQADMLEVGLLTAHAAQLSTPAEVDHVFEMCTISAARVMRLDDPTLREGARANFNILDAPTVQEALRGRPGRQVYRNGRKLAERRHEYQIYR